MKKNTQKTCAIKNVAVSLYRKIKIRTIINIKNSKKMKVTIKDIYNQVSYINPSVSTISSIGSFVEEINRQVANSFRSKLMAFLPTSSLAYKIISENLKDFFSEKQMWVIAYELQKNAEYVAKLQAELEDEERRAEDKAAASKAKLNANKEASQEVLNFVKSSKKLLKDYYAFVKKNKKYSKEYYSKKFTLESATEFVNLK